MSTRGSVAIGTPKNWRGVYNHWDSYPTGLGRSIWQHLQETLTNGKTLNDFLGAPSQAAIERTQLLFVRLSPHPSQRGFTTAKRQEKLHPNKTEPAPVALFPF